MPRPLTCLLILLTAGLYLAPPAPAASQAVRVFRAGAPQGEGLSGLGTIRCRHSLELGFDESGRIASVGVQEGDQVKKGQVVARLDTSVLEAQVTAKEAEIAIVQGQIRHLSEKSKELEGLYASRAVTLREVKDTNYELEQARAKLGQARAELATLAARKRLALLKAPIAGTVAQRYLEAGEVVGGQENKVIKLVACTQVWAEVAFGEKHYRQIQAGRRVLVQADAFPDRDFLGEVERISPEVDEKERTFQVKVLLENPDLVLRPGMFVRATLMAAAPGDPLWIPKAAILGQVDDKAVVQVVEQGRLTKRVVKLGQTQGEMVETLEGLTPGEAVAVKPAAPAGGGS